MAAPATSPAQATSQSTNPVPPKPPAPRAAGQAPGAGQDHPDGFRPELLQLPFTVEAILARGVMKVRELLNLRPGGIVRSNVSPGAPIQISSGRAVLGSADASMEAGVLTLRVTDVGEPNE